MTQSYAIRRTLPAIACPICGEMLQPQPGTIMKAEKWLDCLSSSFALLEGVN
jgi:hypothetical protein